MKTIGGFWHTPNKAERPQTRGETFKKLGKRFNRKDVCKIYLPDGDGPDCQVPEVSSSIEWRMMRPGWIGVPPLPLGLGLNSRLHIHVNEMNGKLPLPRRDLRRDSTGEMVLTGYVNLPA